jgi:hypothetical protein
MMYVREYARRGAVIPYFKGPAIQRGNGIGSILRGLLRFAKPLFRRGVIMGKKFINSNRGQSILNQSKKVLKKTGANILADIVEGKSVGETMREARKTIKKEISVVRKREANKLRGNESQQPVKRKRTLLYTGKKKKKHATDVLSKYYSTSRGIFKNDSNDDIFD